MSASDLSEFYFRQINHTSDQKILENIHKEQIDELKHYSDLLGRTSIFIDK